MKTGWFQTWPDSPNDGIYWLNGYKMGRVYIMWDGQWKWNTWIRPCASGLSDTKEAAKAEIEARATTDPKLMSESCGSLPSKPDPQASQCRA